MARNEEKALTLFNKWHTFKKEFHESKLLSAILFFQCSHFGYFAWCTDPLNKRPLAASECQSLPDAEKARRGLLKEISKKIALIQNGGFPGTIVLLLSFPSIYLTLPSFQRAWASQGCAS
jgi:hypothetical protein